MIFIRVMTNNSYAIIAIVAVAALLIATTAVSSLTNQAFAGGHKRTSFHQTAAQSCVNQNARCQNILDQIQGHDNAGTVTGNQPTTGTVPLTPIPIPVTPITPVG